MGGFERILLDPDDPGEHRGDRHSRHRALRASAGGTRPAWPGGGRGGDRDRPLYLHPGDSGPGPRCAPARRRQIAAGRPRARRSAWRRAGAAGDAALPRASGRTGAAESRAGAGSGVGACLRPRRAGAGARAAESALWRGSASSRRRRPAATQRLGAGILGPDRHSRGHHRGGHHPHPEWALDRGLADSMPAPMSRHRSRGRGTARASFLRGSR